MNAEPERNVEQPVPAEDEVQQGGRRGFAMDERLKRALKQHPQRDEPRVHSVESGPSKAALDLPAP